MLIIQVRKTEAHLVTGLSEAAPGVCSSEGLLRSSASSSFLSRGPPPLPQHPYNPARTYCGGGRGGVPCPKDNFREPCQGT